jgi:hypothetical protein
MVSFVQNFVHIYNRLSFFGRSKSRFTRSSCCLCLCPPLTLLANNLANKFSLQRILVHRHNSTAVECSVSLWSMLHQMFVRSEKKADDYIIPEILISSLYGCYMLHSSLLCKQTNGYQCCYVPTDCPSVLYL